MIFWKYIFTLVLGFQGLYDWSLNFICLQLWSLDGREERNGRREVGERNFCSASFWPQKPPTLVSTVCLGARSFFMVVIGTKIIGLFWLIKMNFEVENVFRRF